MRTSRYRVCIGLFTAIAPWPAYAAAPIYFDLGGLIAWGLAAIVLFAFLVIAVFRAKSKLGKSLAVLGLLAYVLLPYLYVQRQHQIRKPNESWVLFTNERSHKSEKGSPLFGSLCQKVAVDEGRGISITGFRLLTQKSLPSEPARGWASPIDFYSSFGNTSSTVEAIQQGIVENSSPLFLEFIGNDGNWKRYSFDVAKKYATTEEAGELRASHGIEVEQVSTGYERSYFIFGASISVIDLATKSVVARNTGLIHDIYWGAHNNHRLLAGPLYNRCGYQGMGVSMPDNYVGSWLFSAVATKSLRSGMPNPAVQGTPRDIAAQRP